MVLDVPLAHRVIPQQMGQHACLLCVVQTSIVILVIQVLLNVLVTSIAIGMGALVLTVKPKMGNALLLPVMGKNAHR